MWPSAYNCTISRCFAAVTALLAAAHSAHARQECYPPPPNMVAWYAGDTCWSNDLLGNHHGRYAGGPPPCPPEPYVGEGALSFTGETHITVPHDLALEPGTGEFTIDLWIRTVDDMGIIAEKFGPFGYTFSFWQDMVSFSVCSDRGGRCWFAEAAIPINDGTWHHLAGSVDPYTVALYIDGVPEAAVGPPEGFGNISSTEDLHIGESLVGAMDEIEIFNRWLSAGEILAIYDAGSAGKCKPSCLAPPSDMVAWYTGDDGSPADLLGNHPGAYSLDPPPSSDEFLVGGGAMAFPGDNYVVVPHHAGLDPAVDGFTIDLWLRTESDTGNIAMKYDLYGYYFAVYFNGMPGFGVCDDTSGSCWIAQAYVPVDDGAWHHLAGVVEPGGIQLFIDGVPEASTGIPGLGAIYSSVDLHIGEQFVGQMDEIEVFSRALSGDEIQSLYEAGSAGKCKDCRTIYVPADYPTIQAAIDHAKPCDEVVVSMGVYEEAIDLRGKAITVSSAEGAQSTTIDAAGRTGSAVKCVAGEGPDTILQGFTITGGTGDTATLGHAAGGGMFNYNGSSPTVLDCVFESNAAQEGGGMYNGPASQPLVSGCTFLFNETVGSPPNGFRGGGMYNAGGSAPQVEGCLFELNTAGITGGMYNAPGSGPTVIGCEFNDNDGGGMYNGADSSPTVIACDFIANTSTSGGGGMLNWWGADALVVDCTFSGNTSYNHGGGMDNHSNTTAVVNCRFLGNVATTGGGLNSEDSALAVINCLFTGNIGGGMHNDPGSTPRLSTCSLFGNIGGGILGGDLQVHNSILWDNGAQQIVGAEPTSAVHYCVVQGGWSGNGSHNTDVDPQCVDPDGFDDIYGTLDDDPRLAPGSPCIDSGDNVAFLTLALDLGGLMPPGDLDGRARFMDDVDSPDTGHGAVAVVDMGAYEYHRFKLVDLNKDGVVDATDLALLLGSWGPY